MAMRAPRIERKLLAVQHLTEVLCVRIGLGCGGGEGAQEECAGAGLRRAAELPGDRQLRPQSAGVQAAG